MVLQAPEFPTLPAIVESILPLNLAVRAGRKRMRKEYWFGAAMFFVPARTLTSCSLPIYPHRSEERGASIALGATAELIQDGPLAQR